MGIEYIHGKQFKIGLRKTFIYIGDTKVKFYNDRKTYKEYLADRFNPNINGGADFRLACKNHRFNRDAKKSKIEFPVICSVKRYRVEEPYYSIVLQTWRIVYLEEATTERSYLQLKKIHKPELPADYKFPKHLGCNDDLYKDLKEYHPDESRKEKRLRIRSYAKKRREENNIYITKEYGSIVAGIISLTITLFDAIKTIIVLAFKLPFFPFWLLGNFFADYQKEMTDDLKYQKAITDFGYFFIATLGIVFVSLLVGIFFAFYYFFEFLFEFTG
jgi:hypothetical protein